MSKGSKIFRILVAAVMLLGQSCTKYNLKSEEREIFFQTAPSFKNLHTKAAVGFEPDKAFISYAYYLPFEQKWANNKESAYLYVNGSKVNYSGGVWKDSSTTHYWPRTGRLTFFSWTDNTNNPSVAGTTITCNTNGIQIPNFNTLSNSNKDLMVSQIAEDKEPELNGVPTVFSHILSKFEFRVLYSEKNANTEYKINSIVFNNLYRQSDYDEKLKMLWGNRQDLGNITMFNSEAGVDVTNSAQSLSATNSILIPQEIKEEKNTITITYSVYEDNVFKAKKTEEKKLSDVYSKQFFQAGMKYVLTISIGQNEVYWAPGVKDWEISEKLWYE